MKSKPELKPEHKHLLRLVRKGQDEHGWAKVSKQVWPFMINLPSELVELEEVGEGGIAKLTRDGNVVIDWI